MNRHVCALRVRIQSCGTVGGLMVLTQIRLDGAEANVAIELAPQSE